MNNLIPTSKNRAEMHHAKPSKIPSILRNFQRFWRRHLPKSGTKPDAATTACSDLTSSGTLASSAASPRSYISKQMSLESASSFATTVPSTISSSSPTSANARVPLPDVSAFVSKPLEAIPSLESLLDIPAAVDEQSSGDIIVTPVPTATSICQGTTSDSWCTSFGSAPSSPMLVPSCSADDVNREPILPRNITAARSVDLDVPEASHLECAVCETADGSSIESYKSVSPIPSTGDSSSFKSTFDEANDELLATPAISDTHHQPSVSPTPRGSDAARTADIDTHSATTLWDNAQGLSWTDCFSSDSSSSSLYDLASSNNSSPDLVNTQNELPLPAHFGDIRVSPNIFFPLSTFHSGQPILPSIGVAATLLMLGHTQYPDEEDNVECPPPPGTPSSSASPTPTSVIAAQDPDEVFDFEEFEESTDYTVVGPGSGLDMALYIIAEEDEPEESHYEEDEPEESYYEQDEPEELFREDFDDTESIHDYRHQEQRCTIASRNAFVAHIIENATSPSLWRRTVPTGIVWDDMQSFPSIREEDEESAGTGIVESFSRNSLPTASSDLSDYAQYSLPTESSSGSGLSDDYDSRLPPRPMSRCCMREDFAELDDE